MSPSRLAPIVVLAMLLSAGCGGGGDQVARCPFLGGCDTLRPPPVPADRVAAAPVSAPAAPRTARATPTAARRDERLPAAPLPDSSIAMPVAGPVAAVRIDLPTDTLWVGDTLRLTAAAEDSAGTRVSGVTLRWRFAPGGAVASGADGLPIARRAGPLLVSAEAAGVRAESRLTVLPVVRGVVLGADGAPSGGAQVSVTDAAGDERVAVVDADGTFVLRLARQLAAPVTLVAVARDVGDSYGSRVILMPLTLDEPVTMVLIPARWTIAGGREHGTTVMIDAAAALRAGADRSRFWRTYRSSVTGETRAVAWPARVYPLPVAFRGRLAGLAPARAAAFWSVARAIERDLGMALFRPATDEESRAASGLVTVDVDPALTLAGLTFVSFEGRGEIVEAAVTLRSASSLDDPSVLGHELVHALGFGHVTAWQSLMALAAPRPARLSVQDIAYIQLGLRLGELQLRTGARAGTPVARGADAGASRTPDGRRPTTAANILP
jgi:hypothetical protein